MDTQNRGFSLIEIMIALAIVGILAFIAYPAYSKYITKARRADGQIALLHLANSMQRYFVDNNTYKGASLAKLQINPVTTQGFYKLSITKTSETTYLLRATPLAVQAKNDMNCKILTLDQQGQKGQTGSAADCWN